MRGWQFTLFVAGSLTFVVAASLVAAWAAFGVAMVLWDRLSVDAWPDAGQHAFAIGSIAFTVVAMALYHRWATPLWRRLVVRHAPGQQHPSQSIDH